MRFAGIDIGSRSIKLVVLENNAKMDSRVVDTGFDPMAAANQILKNVTYDHILATGYGRNLFEIAFDAPTVTEIKAHARGAKEIFPQATSVLDIGGQDSKAIAMNGTGKVIKFEMNDRCAAGTGKFLEIMSKSLGYELDAFGTEALAAEKNIAISSMCTVFAESEVTSLVAKGENRREIARGLHLSVVRRAVGMLQRVAVDKGPIVFSGGVALNRCMPVLLKDALKREILLPPAPQMVGAFGAALLAAEMTT
jgi:predicted CoA-substrate-specific enzyme activase